MRRKRIKRENRLSNFIIWKEKWLKLIKKSKAGVEYIHYKKSYVRK